jgi:hypothetical protein
MRDGDDLCCIGFPTVGASVSNLQLQGHHQSEYLDPSIAVPRDTE